MSASTACNSPTRTRRGGWRRALSIALVVGSGAVLSAAGLTGCGAEETGEEVIESCNTEAVKAIAADGTCQWMSSCDAEGLTRCDGGTRNQCEDLPASACSLDTDCRTVSTTSCPDCAPGADPTVCSCTTTTLCEVVPSNDCASLDEAACVASDVCHPSFGWTTAPGTSSGGGSTDDAAGAPCAPEFGCEPWEPEPVWAYLGCVDNTSGPCAGLDHSACEQHPACEPIWGGPDCECAPEEDCACPAIAVYEGCRQAPTTGGCEANSTEAMCRAEPGCTWEYTWDEKVACPDCEGDNCGCDAIAPQTGTCIEDYPRAACGDILDEASCVAVGCEWDATGTGADPAPAPPCDCDDTDEACWDACNDGNSGQRPIAPAGACVEPAPPTPTCADNWDELSCESNADCQWYPYDGTEPAPAPDPCECPVDDPDCGCAGFIAPADGYCGDRSTEPPSGCADATDELSCSSIPGCSWTADEAGNLVCTDETVTEPPSCEDFDEATCRMANGCMWTDPGAAPPCPDGDPNCDALIACDPESARADDGICYDSTGVEAPDACCEGGQPEPGRCETVAP